MVKNILNYVSGKILKSIGGFYHVETPGGVLICKARGLFRMQKISPVAGDFAEILLEENNEPVIIGISERKNMIARPPLANIDIAVIVSSTTEPPPNSFILDKLTVIFESKNIEPCFIFTKIDKKLMEDFSKIYSEAGFRVFSIDNINAYSTNNEMSSLLAYLAGKTTALIGNSGVGKSSLLNNLLPDLNINTAEISKKLNRGKHTTRQIELYKYENKNGTGYIADTPGFSTVEAERYGDFSSVEIADYFREFHPFLGKCRYKGCCHIKEDGCEIIKNVSENGSPISKSRYDNYVRIYKEIKISENIY